MKTLYLGPKVSMSLPFVLIQLRKLAAILIVTLFSLSAFSQELIFQNPTLESGTSGANGAIYRFRSVTANGNVDALLKVISRSDSRVKLKDPDFSNKGFEKAFQPKVEYNGGNVSGTVNWWMEFELSFVTKNTTTLANVQSFNLTALDIDGDGEAMREYISFYKLKSYIVETPTLLAVNTVTDMLSAGAATGTRFIGPQLNYKDIDTTTTKLMATINYQSANKFSFRIGGLRNGPGQSNAGDRMNSIWFKTFNYSAAALMLPVKLANFNAVLSNRQVLLNWTTTEEKNVSHFVIEKSNNGRDYNDAGLLFTEGNSEVLKSYQYKDWVSGQDAVLYYRLRIVDLDGRETFSAVRMIRQESMGKNQLELLTYPNPIVNELRITIPEGWQNKQVTYELFDGSGRLLKQVVNKNASQTEILNVQSVQSGTFILRAFTNEDKLVQRIIKS